MTEEQSQFAHYSRQISSTSDDSVGTNSSIKLLMAPKDEKKPTVSTASRCSKLLVVIALLVIIAIISFTVAIIASKNTQGNN